MSNILDYIAWRGDIELTNSKFNELDNIILSRFSYLPFEKIEIKENESIESLSKKFEKIDEDSFNMPDDKKLIKEIGMSERFKNLLVSDYYALTDYKKEKQFVAIVIHLGDGEMYLSYGGTDNTLLGWKEDFNLSYMVNIPSQLEGLKYIKKISKKYTEQMHLGGHSKGGNIAVYSAVFSPKSIQKRIIDVTNHDGPGFDKSIIEKEEYKNIIKKVHTYIPQSSIIGRLLEHEEDYVIVKSMQKGIMQHDIYSWQVLGTSFIKEDKITNGSEMINETVRNWLKTTTPEQRGNFINLMYEVVTTTKAKTFKEFMNAWPKNIGIILKTYKHIDEKDKKIIGQMVLSFFIAAKDCIKEKII